MPPIIHREKCRRCGRCAQICPLNVLYQPGPQQNIAVRYPEECWHCRACVLECRNQAITMRYPLSHFVLHREKA
jgi:adenylylsulfate reductase subunit B